MTRTIQAIYENGIFRPTEPVSLPEHTPVTLHAELEPLEDDEGRDYSAIFRAAVPGHTGIPDLAERHNEHQP